MTVSEFYDQSSDGVIFRGSGGKRLLWVIEVPDRDRNLHLEITDNEWIGPTGVSEDNADLCRIAWDWVQAKRYCVVCRCVDCGCASVVMG